MSIISKPNTFTDNTTAEASEVNDNFDTIYNDYNGGISAANLATDAVTTAKIADSNVTTAKIADSNVTTAKIADANVTNAKLATGAGQPGGAWTTYTPTLTNLSGGTQSYAKYTQIGKTVHVRFKYTLAGAGVGGAVSFTLPVTASSEYATGGEVFQGTVALIDAGTNFYAGVVLWTNSTTVNIRYQTGTTINAVSSTAPFTWGSGDFIQCHFTYEAA